MLFTLADTLVAAASDGRTGQPGLGAAGSTAQRLAPAPVGFAVQPWFYTPPVSPWFCAPLPGCMACSRRRRDIKARIVYTQDWDVQTLETARPPLVVLSEYDYDDALRLHDPAAATYLQVLRRDYAARLVLPSRSDLEYAYKPLTGCRPRSAVGHALPGPIICIYTGNDASADFGYTARGPSHLQFEPQQVREDMQKQRARRY